jgi:DNA adenine methylase Dam
VKSPLNYTGNKYNLLPQILPLFPTEINTFYDVFGGSGTVGINIEAKEIVYNDTNTYLSELIRFFYECNLEETMQNIHKTIKEFNMGKNRYDEYYVFRNYYNQNKTPLLLFILGCHAFNYDIRFNKEGQFNKAYGNRSYNKNIEKRFIDFNNIAKTKNIKFYNRNFIDIIPKDKNDFVYLDPPYLPTMTSYTENGAWSPDKEQQMYNYIDMLNDNDIKFALSNVLIYHSKDNEMLRNWSKKYNVHMLNHNYNNNNCHRKDNTLVDQEVLITNY